MRGAWLVLALWLVGSPTAADAAHDDARTKFLAGLAQARRGDWPAALADFTAAYAAAPEPNVLFNLAGAQYRCGKLLASNTNYRRLLASAQLSSAQRAAVHRQIERIERRMPRLRVHIQGLRDDDRVLLDRARLYPDELDRDMWVDPGRHQIEVVRAAGVPESRTTTLSEGERRVLALSLP
jgi:tetratricopeptide (TPR) repeat protein